MWDITVAFLLVALDRVHVVPAVRWFEQHVDYAAVQASLVTGTTYTWQDRVAAYMAFHRRVRIN